MHLKAIKKDSDIVLDGVQIETERHDGQLQGLTLTDKKGALVIVRQGPYTGLQVFVPGPPPMVTRYRIQGEIKKVKFSELFESEFDASMRRNELDMTAEECPIEKVEVPE